MNRVWAAVNSPASSRLHAGHARDAGDQAALLLMRLFRDRLLARLVESHPVRRATLIELFRSLYPNREILPE